MADPDDRPAAPATPEMPEAPRAPETPQTPETPTPPVPPSSDAGAAGDAGGRAAPRAAAGRAPDLGAALDRSRPALAVFVDLENMAWSPDSASVTFDLGRLMAWLERQGRPVLRKAYADWSRMRDFRTVFLRHGFEQVQCTYVNATKNALDMQLAVDAVEAALDAGDALAGVVLVTADSDFGPLARTLRRRGVAVIGVGWAAKAADLYRAQCDRFVDYETLLGAAPRRAPQDRPAVRPAPRPPRAAAAEPAPGDRPFLYDPREGGAPPDDADAGPAQGEGDEEEGYAFFETDTGERRP
jgi:uncharacterized LabA/DUF88 family protein